MNCREFENLLLPLVRSEKLESDARETALSHAETCSRCAARLLDERSLMAGLRTLAMNSRNETAPVHLEPGLRKAFHEWQAGLEARAQQAQNPPESARPPAHLDRESSRTARRRVFAFVGLAASILLLIGLILNRKIMERPNEQASRFPRPKLGSPGSAASRESAAREPGPRVPQTRLTLPGKEEIKRARERPRPPQRARPQRSQLLARSSGSVFREAEDPETREVQTEFLPLTIYRTLSPLEQGQVVRVRLPRSALHAVGLPMNMEGSREPVQADVVLAEDGTAVAVRFVR
jgi:hypothetical protein